MIYVILGMHKSGTTLLSSILHKSGIHMGEYFDNGSYDSGNQYEREEMLMINFQLLRVQNDQTLKLKLAKKTRLSEYQEKAIQELVYSCEKKYHGQDWGMKDPRTALTYPLWKPHLPEHKLIAIFRPPEQIWRRYRWKGIRRRYVNFYWAWHFLNRWLEHNQTIIDVAEAGENKCIVISYLEFMRKKSAIDELSQFVGRSLVDERKLSMYRNKNSYDMPLLIAKWLIKIVKRKSIDNIMKQLESLSTSYRRQNNG